MAVAVRYAALSDIGLVRSSNQDSAYAGPHLLVVADGMGGHAGGDVASSLAIGELAGLDEESHGNDTLTNLSAAVASAHLTLLNRVAQEPALSGMGTTVTALLRSGNRFALAHIGDSRAYLLRDGELVQLTKDHTFVQTLVDDGRLTPEEAEQHPQRSVLIRVLSDVVDNVEPDLSMREARIGDRYLLCSDGLSGVVSLQTLEEAMSAGHDPATTCELLVQYARRGGAPDNVTCIVADVVDETRRSDTVPFVVGAATAQRTTRAAGTSAAERAAALTSPRRARETAGPHALESGTPDDGRPSPGRAGRLLRRLAAVAVLTLIVAGGCYGAYRWVHAQFYVGVSGTEVAIFRGLPQDLGPLALSRVEGVATDIPLANLPSYSQQRVRKGIVADDHAAAEGIVTNLREQAAACVAERTPAPGSTANPSATPSAPATPSAAATTPGVTPLTSTGAATTAPSAPVTTAPGATPSPTGDGGSAQETCGGLE